jgi:hypothetical protein
VTVADEDVVAVEVGMDQAAFVGGWCEILVDLLDEPFGQHSHASVAGGAGGA